MKINKRKRNIAAPKGTRAVISAPISPEAQREVMHDQEQTALSMVADGLRTIADAITKYRDIQAIAFEGGSNGR